MSKSAGERDEDAAGLLEAGAAEAGLEVDDCAVVEQVLHVHAKTAAPFEEAIACAEVEIDLRAGRPQGAGRDRTAGEAAAVLEDHRDILAAEECIAQPEPDGVALIVVVKLRGRSAGVIDAVGRGDRVAVVEKGVDAGPKIAVFAAGRCDVVGELDAVDGSDLEVDGRVDAVLTAGNEQAGIDLIADVLDIVSQFHRLPRRDLSLDAQVELVQRLRMDRLPHDRALRQRRRIEQPIVGPTDRSEAVRRVGEVEARRQVERVDDRLAQALDLVVPVGSDAVVDREAA